ncbi:WD repeat-containing protein [Plasmodium brasilianum]|uniref:WD repeat-containing protein n=1 Tax=Plasmodium brasilianum TaxID=5824 RepID=A0ACB9YAR3_PLABR|nr:WD repeat-containing protein [Plasmodium brasilianum]
MNISKGAFSRDGMMHNVVEKQKENEKMHVNKLNELEEEIIKNEYTSVLEKELLLRNANYKKDISFLKVHLGGNIIKNRPILSKKNILYASSESGILLIDLGRKKKKRIVTSFLIDKMFYFYDKKDKEEYLILKSYNNYIYVYRITNKIFHFIKKFFIKNLFYINSFGKNGELCFSTWEFCDGKMYMNFFLLRFIFNYEKDMHNLQANLLLNEEKKKEENEENKENKKDRKKKSSSMVAPPSHVTYTFSSDSEMDYNMKLYPKELAENRSFEEKGQKKVEGKNWTNVAYEMGGKINEVMNVPVSAYTVREREKASSLGFSTKLYITAKLKIKPILKIKYIYFSMIDMNSSLSKLVLANNNIIVIYDIVKKWYNIIYYKDYISSIKISDDNFLCIGFVTGYIYILLFEELIMLDSKDNKGTKGRGRLTMREPLHATKDCASFIYNLSSLSNLFPHLATFEVDYISNMVHRSTTEGESAPEIFSKKEETQQRIFEKNLMDDDEFTCVKNIPYIDFHLSSEKVINMQKVNLIKYSWHSHSVYNITIDEKKVISCGEEAVILFYDINNGSYEFISHLGSPCYYVYVNKKKNLIICSSLDNNILCINYNHRLFFYKHYGINMPLSLRNLYSNYSSIYLNIRNSFNIFAKQINDTYNYGTTRGSDRGRDRTKESRQTKERVHMPSVCEVSIEGEGGPEALLEYNMEEEKNKQKQKEKSNFDIFNNDSSENCLANSEEGDDDQSDYDENTEGDEEENVEEEIIQLDRGDKDGVQEGGVEEDSLLEEGIEFCTSEEEVNIRGKNLNGEITRVNTLEGKRKIRKRQNPIMTFEHIQKELEKKIYNHTNVENSLYRNYQICFYCDSNKGLIFCFLTTFSNLQLYNIEKDRHVKFLCPLKTIYKSRTDAEKVNDLELILFSFNHSRNVLMTIEKRNYLMDEVSYSLSESVLMQTLYTFKFWRLINNLEYINVYEYTITCDSLNNVESKICIEEENIHIQGKHENNYDVEKYKMILSHPFLSLFLVLEYSGMITFYCLENSEHVFEKCIYEEQDIDVFDIYEDKYVYVPKGCNVRDLYRHDPQECVSAGGEVEKGRNGNENWRRGNGSWGRGNGSWGRGNGSWGRGNGSWGRGNGSWRRGNGSWGRGNVNWGDGTGTDNPVESTDTGKDKKITIIKNVNYNNHKILQGAISEDGKILCICHDNFISIWNTITIKTLAIINHPLYTSLNDYIFNLYKGIETIQTQDGSIYMCFYSFDTIFIYSLHQFHFKYQKKFKGIIEYVKFDKYTSCMFLAIGITRRFKNIEKNNSSFIIQENYLYEFNPTYLKKKKLFYSSQNKPIIALDFAPLNSKKNEILSNYQKSTILVSLNSKFQISTFYFNNYPYFMQLR